MVNGSCEVIQFLKSNEFSQLVMDIVDTKVIALKNEVCDLKNEIKVLKESNIDLIKLLTADQHISLIQKKKRINAMKLITTAALVLI